MAKHSILLTQRTALDEGKPEEQCWHVHSGVISSFCREFLEKSAKSSNRQKRFFSSHPTSEHVLSRRRRPLTKSRDILMFDCLQKVAEQCGDTTTLARCIALVNCQSLFCVLWKTNEYRNITKLNSAALQAWGHKGNLTWLVPKAVVSRNELSRRCQPKLTCLVKGGGVTQIGMFISD